MDTVSRIVGTVSDLVRIQQSSYATTLPYQYNFNCTDNGVTGYVANNSQSPSPNNGSLATPRCPPRARWHGPERDGHLRPAEDPDLPRDAQHLAAAPSDPHCSTPVTWRTSDWSIRRGTTIPTTAAGERQPVVPRLHAPAAVLQPAGQQGGAAAVDVDDGAGLRLCPDVTNNGDPIVGLMPTTAWPVVTDNFAGGYVQGAMTATPAPSLGATGTYEWIPGGVTPSTSNPFSFGIHNLATGNSIQLTFPLAPPFQPGAVVNTAAIVMSGPEAVDWYAKDPGTLTDQVSRPITQATSTFTVIKRIINETGKPTPPGAYLVKVDCTPTGRTRSSP